MLRLVPLGLAVTALATLLATPLLAQERTFVSRLEPTKRVYPAETTARGLARFWLTEDKLRLRYEVTVYDVEAVTQIHVHFGPEATTPDGQYYRLPPGEDEHGDIVAFLMNFKAGGVKGDGVVAKGELTVKDLIGPLKRESQAMSYLVGHMEKGWAYVAVHVLQDMGGTRKFCCPDGLRGVVRAGSL